jgi:hypothetical protein
MKEAKTLRISLVTAALAIAACSQAQVGLILVSNGAGAISGSTGIVAEGVDAQVGGFGPLSMLTYTVNTGTLMGSGTYTGTGGTLNFNLTYQASTLQFLSSTEGSIDGTWTYTGGTGTYAGKVGSGTLALTFLMVNSSAASTGTTFAGELAPEPAPVVAMGLGVAGLLIRRRRKS